MNERMDGCIHQSSYSLSIYFLYFCDLLIGKLSWFYYLSVSLREISCQTRLTLTESHQMWHCTGLSGRAAFLPLPLKTALISTTCKKQHSFPQCTKKKTALIFTMYKKQYSFPHCTKKKHSFPQWTKKKQHSFPQCTKKTALISTMYKKQHSFPQCTKNSTHFYNVQVNILLRWCMAHFVYRFCFVRYRSLTDY